MDFNDYIQSLSDLDSQEVKTELETFYTLNVSTFEFFTAINETIQKLLHQPNISPIALKQLESTLPFLIRLKTSILELDSDELTAEYKSEITKAVDKIKTKMLINEVESTSIQFYQLLKSNNDAFADELRQRELRHRDEIERNIATVHDAEKYFQEFGIECCEWTTLQLLAEKSANKSILKKVAEAIMAPEEFNDTSNEDFWLNYEFQPYLVAEKLNSNPNIDVDMRQSIFDCMEFIADELIDDSRTSLTFKEKLKKISPLQQHYLRISQIEEEKQKKSVEVMKSDKGNNRGFYILMTVCAIAVVICWILLLFVV